MEREQIRKSFEDSAYILVGIGEEWEDAPEAGEAYGKLGELLSGKDYFVVTTAADGRIWESGLDPKRIATPCGNRKILQCGKGCCEKLWKEEEVSEPICPECGAPLVPNTIDASPYVEAGYLPAWEAYRKWLQGTINRKLLLLELGVGFRTPTVIRWPFEKTAYLNQKAHLYRVHEKLFQLPEQLEDRGTSIKKNSVIWLKSF